MSVDATLELGNLGASSLQLGFDLVFELVGVLLRRVGKDLEDILGALCDGELLRELVAPIVELRTRSRAQFSLVAVRTAWRESPGARRGRERGWESPIRCSSPPARAKVGRRGDSLARS